MSIRELSCFLMLKPYICVDKINKDLSNTEVITKVKFQFNISPKIRKNRFVQLKLVIVALSFFCRF
jgi:hypothetical protein